MGQKRSYKQYPKEFKEEAVGLVLEQGYSVPEASKSSGIAANMLYRWNQSIEDQKQGLVMSEDERDELKRLRMEKDILKKASAFFAKEMK
jgi:transposase